MKRSTAAAFGAGMLFAVGLAVSGMTMPSKVAGFLDLAGAWDPSLAFVMVSAIAVHFIAYRLVMRRRSPLFDVRFHVPTRNDVDARLVLGAAVFGIGWGLGGFCPGPGLVAAGGGSLGAGMFVAGMTLGIVVEQLVVRASASAAHRSEHRPPHAENRAHPQEPS